MTDSSMASVDLSSLGLPSARDMPFQEFVVFERREGNSRTLLRLLPPKTLTPERVKVLVELVAGRVGHSRSEEMKAYNHVLWPDALVTRNDKVVGYLIDDFPGELVVSFRT